MRLTTITNWAYGATVMLTLSSGAAMLFAADAHDTERAAVAQRYELDQASSQVAVEIYTLTNHARQFVISGDPTHLMVYRREFKALKSVEDRIKLMGDKGAKSTELSALAEAIRWADMLHDEQKAAIAAWQAGNAAEARQIVFGAEYERELGRVANSVERFQYLLDQRTASNLTSATNLSKLWQRISEFMLVITAVLFLCVLYFILRRRILKPVVRLSDVIMRLADQDFVAEIPEIDQIDEIGDMAQAIIVLRQNGLERQHLERVRDQEVHFRTIMARMNRRLQSCETIGEIGEVAINFIPQITDNKPGCLYIRGEGRDVLVELCHWLSPVQSTSEFSPLQCWAVRRGKVHRLGGDAADVPCGHLAERSDGAYATICVPLTGQQQTIGLLYLELERTADGDGLGMPETYIDILAENIGLSIANLELRKALSKMAMVDPLTGLSNRRQLTQALEQFSDEAQHRTANLSCLVLDIDHFKQFNDRFGHEAGDEVLVQVGAALTGLVRDDALAFRFGGEEFVVLIPDLGHEHAVGRAEEIRSRIASLEIHHEGHRLGSISVSIGVASAPAQCARSKLVSTADAALLKAKEAGRNRVVVASSSGEKAAA